MIKINRIMVAFEEQTNGENIDCSIELVAFSNFRGKTFTQNRDYDNISCNDLKGKLANLDF